MQYDEAVRFFSKKDAFHTMIYVKVISLARSLNLCSKLQALDQNGDLRIARYSADQVPRGLSRVTSS